MCFKKYMGLGLGFLLPISANAQTAECPPTANNFEASVTHVPTRSPAQLRILNFGSGNSDGLIGGAKTPPWQNLIEIVDLPIDAADRQAAWQVVKIPPQLPDNTNSITIQGIAIISNTSANWAGFYMGFRNRMDTYDAWQPNIQVSAIPSGLPGGGGARSIVSTTVPVTNREFEIRVHPTSDNSQIAFDNGEYTIAANLYVESFTSPLPSYDCYTN